MFIAKIHTFSLQIDMKLLSDLSRIDRFDASWSAIEKKEGAVLKQLKTIATIRSVGASTRIEGSRLNNDEVSVLIDQISSAPLSQRDEQEVAGYFETLDTIAENCDAIPTTESQIKGLHKMLLKYVEKDVWHRGQYKKASNAVAAKMLDGSTQLIFKTTEPGMATEAAMSQLLNWYRKDRETLPLIKIALFVYDFLSIHPFQDGNGRLSRLLTTLLLLKQNYSWIQYVSFEHEIEYQKANYYQALRITQQHRPGEDVTAWFRFFVDCMLRMQSQLLAKLSESKKMSAQSQREERILFFVENNPGCQSGDISTKLNIPLPTVKKTLAELYLRSLLDKTGQGRSTAYMLN